MNTDLKKEVGIILFMNTSLSEKEEHKFFEIYEDLYQYGVKLKNKAIRNR